MKHDIRYCSTCMLNTMLKEMNLIPLSEDIQKKEVNDFLKKLPDRSDETPVTIQDIYVKRLHELSNYDYYKEIREKDNREMLALADTVSDLIQNSENPFETAMKFSIFGNLIDPASHSDKSAEDVLREALSIPLEVNDALPLMEALKKARRIFYIADNAGEIVMDKLFIEYIKEHCLRPDCQVDFGVRGEQIHNDALSEDARFVGLDTICNIIDSGNYYTGTIIEESAEDYIEAYKNADLVISKGMGNYETLDERTDKPICFLLVSKCIPISSHLGVSPGSPVCSLRENRQPDS